MPDHADHLGAVALLGEAAVAFRELLGAYDGDRLERLDHAYFRQAEPEELLYDQIEALWAPITERDDWSLFQAKVDRIGAAREAWGLGGGA